MDEFEILVRHEHAIDTARKNNWSTKEHRLSEKKPALAGPGATGEEILDVALLSLWLVEGARHHFVQPAVTPMMQ